MARIYLIKLYLRHFFLILVGLELFYLLIDLLQNQKITPDAANLFVLYCVYQLAAALKLTLPLSVALGAVSCVAALVRSSELAAFMALGMSKRRIVAPLFWVSFLLVTLHIALGATKVGDYYDMSQALLKNARPLSPEGGVFVKLNESYIYLQKLYPKESMAENVRIFTFENGALAKLFFAQTARFDKSGWMPQDSQSFVLQGATLSSVAASQKVSQLESLDPKILANISGSPLGLNIADSARALWLLKDEQLNLNKIKNAMTTMVLIPFFAPVFAIFALGFAPTSSRFLSLGKFSASLVVATLCTWGALLALSKYLLSGSALSQLSIAVAVFLLYVYAGYIYRFRMERI